MIISLLCVLWDTWHNGQIWEYPTDSQMKQFQVLWQRVFLKDNKNTRYNRWTISTDGRTVSQHK